MSDTTPNAPVPLPLRGEGKTPYFAWLERRFPNGEIGYNPPVELFLDTPSMPNSWTSHVPDGVAPTDLRIDVYLRRGWNGDLGVLCVGNACPAGDKAPATWDGPTLALLADALAEVEAAGAKAGYKRVAIQGCCEDVEMSGRDRGYALSTDGYPWTNELVKAIA